MKTLTKVLFMVFLLAFVAAGTMVPNEAKAANGEDIQFYPGYGDDGGDLVMEQNGDSNDGASGDPDSLGDGFGFIGESFGDSLSGLIEDGIISIEDYIFFLMKQMDLMQD